MAAALPVFESFSVFSDEQSCGPRWKKWVAKLDNLLLAMDVKDDKRKKALLLHYAGDECLEIYEAMTDLQKGVGATRDGTSIEYETVKASLTTYFTPKKNTNFEVLKFRNIKQLSGESIDTYHTRLRSQATLCEFANVDGEILTQILWGSSSSRLRRRALRDNYTLDQALQEARSQELSERRAGEIEGTTEKIKALNFKDKKTPNKPQHRARTSKSSSGRKQGDKKEKTCYHCGGEFPHKGKCPAKGETCNFCSKLHHFEKVCIQKRKAQGQGKRVKHVTTHDSDDSSDDDFVFAARGGGNLPRFDVLVGKSKQSMRFLADSGASVNLISKQTFNKMSPQPTLENSNSKIYAYGSNAPIAVVGQFKSKLQAGDQTTTATIQVVNGSEQPVLSWDTCRELRLLAEAVLATSARTASGTPCTPPTVPYKAPNANKTADDFPTLFDGKSAEFAKIKDIKIKLHVDKQVKPVAQRHRRVPFHTRKDVEKELESLEERGIIEKVDGPTPWISPVVVVPKKQGGVRVCIDMREANKAIGREKHPMPTLDDLVADLNGATVFSKLDMSQAYHQLELDEASRYITTFSTHVGLRRYKRLLFGVNAASEIFQNAIATILADIPGARNLSDDIIVFGKTQEDHDKALRATLARLNEVGARLNKEKCVFSTDRLVFFGHVFGKDGVAADPDKIKTIISAPAPTNASEVRSFLGMTQYVSRFIPNYATTTEPLRNLTKKETDWKWTEQEIKAFEDLKRALSDTPVMSYFDQRQETTILVDASPVGVGAILTQNGAVISYASRALTPTEQRYSQTDREFLAVVYGVEHFHLYLYGSNFKVITDHKPLLGIVNSQKPTTPRMERWRLRLMPYNMTLQYRPGHDNPADFISRHPHTHPGRENKAEDYVAYIAANAVPKSLTLEAIQDATRSDSTLLQVIDAVHTGKWYVPELASFARFATEMAVVNGVVLRGHRIVIPASLQERVIKIAHQAHQGIVKTKQCIREKVWFPGIDAKVEAEVKSCIPCQASNPQSSREPVISSEIPTKPWIELSMDFAGPFPSGDLLLVVIDDYSRYPEVEVVSSTSSACVLPKLDMIFARQGYPKVLKTDNGPPMNGSQFTSFTEDCGVEHREITPGHPEANGEAERFMRTLNRAIRAAAAEGVNYKTRLPTFLRMYRATPHASTGISPYEALYGRKMNFGLPSTPVPTIPTEPVHAQNPNLHSQIVRNDNQAKLKMRTYADARRHTKPCHLQTGDAVLVKQRRRNKLTPPFCPTPYQVTARKGSMITAERGNHQITRNSSHFKPVMGDVPSPLLAEEGEEDDDVEEEENDAGLASAGPAQQQHRPSPLPRPQALLTPPPTVESRPALQPMLPPQPDPIASPSPRRYDTRSSRGYRAQKPARFS